MNALVANERRSAGVKLAERKGPLADPCQKGSQSSLLDDARRQCCEKNGRKFKAEQRLMPRPAIRGMAFARSLGQ
jgi:hypothetical protein